MLLNAKPAKPAKPNLIFFAALARFAFYLSNDAVTLFCSPAMMRTDEDQRR